MSFEVNFLKSVGRNSKKYFTRASMTEIVKKFGIHSCIFQSTTGDQYQGGSRFAPPPLVQVGLKHQLDINIPIIFFSNFFEANYGLNKKDF